MTLWDKKEKARELRKQGYSLYKIAKDLNGYTSQILEWTKDIILTDDTRLYKPKIIQDRFCKKCKKLIPKVYKGKRIYNGRAYCFNCSSTIRSQSKREDILICIECGKQFKYKGKGDSTCNSCRVKKYKKNVKQKAIDYKGGKCVICGYNKCHRSLCFHHIDSKAKEFQLSDNNKAYCFEKIKIELDKCVLVCSNCHGEIHDNIISLKI